MASSPHDYPRRLVIEGSGDGRSYTELYQGPAFPGFALGLAHDDDTALESDIALPPNRSRTLRLRQTGSSPDFYWSIHNMELWAR